MDLESWFKGYETGVMLHCHMRPIGLKPKRVAALYANGIPAELSADLHGVEALTLITASFAGDVSAAWSFDGTSYSEPVPMEELLAMNPNVIFKEVSPENPRLFFRFRLNAPDADFTSFTLWGAFSKDIPWKGES